MLRFLRTHPYRTAGAAAVVLAGIAWLAFGYFGVHTVFVDDVVSEAAPVFDTQAAPATDPAGTAPPTNAPAETTPPVDAPVGDGGEVASVPAAPASETTAPPTAPPATAPAVPDVVVEYTGTFVDESRYSTSGQAIVLGNGTDQRFLRFEDFATDNGPDLNVYLVNSSTGDVADYVDLGDLKGNIGEQNYEIPADVDLEVYDRVVIWCVRFGVGFGSASLAAP